MLYLTLSSIIYNLWDFLCSDCSNLNLIRWLIFEIVSFVAIATDKLTILRTKIIKLTWKIILMKLKIPSCIRLQAVPFYGHCRQLLIERKKKSVGKLCQLQSFLNNNSSTWPCPFGMALCKPHSPPVLACM